MVSILLRLNHRHNVFLGWSCWDGCEAAITAPGPQVLHGQENVEGPALQLGASGFGMLWTEEPVSLLAEMK